MLRPPAPVAAALVAPLVLGAALPAERARAETIAVAAGESVMQALSRAAPGDNSLR